MMEIICDFYRGKEKITKALPIGTVLTIAAAGSEGSPNTVITDESTGLKKGSRGECLRPKFSIMDPTLTFTLPAYQTGRSEQPILWLISVSVIFPIQRAWK